MKDGISGEDEIGGILFGWNLALFELHILQLFWEWSMELLFFLSSSFFRKDNSILLCLCNIEFLWSFEMVRPFGMSGHTVDILGL